LSIIETERLIVKAATPNSLDNWYGLFSNPEIMQFIGKGVKTFDETRQSLEKTIRHHEKHGFSIGDIFEKTTGEYVGRAGLIYLELNDNQPDIEVGYMMHKKFWKKGYATELAQAFISWGFKHLPVSKLIGIINPQNDKSRHVLEKIGMHYIGRAICYSVEVAKFEIIRPT